MFLLLELIFTQACAAHNESAGRRLSHVAWIGDDAAEVPESGNRFRSQSLARGACRALHAVHPVRLDAEPNQTLQRGEREYELFRKIAQE